MVTKIESTTTIETKLYVDGTTFKTRSGEIGSGYGDSTCNYADLQREVENIGLPNGEYEVVITLKRVGE